MHLELARIRTGQFHDAEEVIEKALDTLDEHPPATASGEPSLTVFEQGLGLFGSPEHAALIDEVVSIA